MGRPGHAVPDRETPSGALSGAELDDLTRSAARGRTERPQVGVDAQDDEILIDEHDVDGEPHEAGVDRPGGPERDALTGR